MDRTASLEEDHSILSREKAAAVRVVKVLAAEFRHLQAVDTAKFELKCVRVLIDYYYLLDAR